MKKILISIVMALTLMQANSIKSAGVDPKVVIARLQKREAQITANIVALRSQLKEAIANGDKATADLLLTNINTAEKLLKGVQGLIAKFAKQQ